MIDQRRLPTEEIYNTYRVVEEVAEAIVEMVIRGAPAIGVASAMAIALGKKNQIDDDTVEEDYERVCNVIYQTRPTAQNLFWAIEMMKGVFEKH